MKSVQEIEKTLLKKKVLVKSSDGDYAARALFVEKIDDAIFVHVEKANGDRVRVRHENVSTLGQLLSGLGDRVLKTVSGVANDSSVNEIKTAAMVKVAQGDQWVREQTNRFGAAISAYRDHGK